MSRTIIRVAESAATARPVPIRPGQAEARSLSRSWPRRLQLVALAMLAAAIAEPASALTRFETLAQDWSSLSWLDPRSAAGFAIMMGIVIFATTLAILHVRERRRWTDQERRLSAELWDLRAKADRTELLAGAERQVIVIWSGRDGDPAFEGDPSLIGEGASFKRVLAFGAWVAPTDAAQLEGDLDRLRSRGEGFRRTLATQSGLYIDAEGRTVSGRALLRLRDVSAERSGRLLAEAEAAQSQGDLGRMRDLVDAIGAPVWLRGPDGKLAWANRAYCAAIEAASIEDARARALELMERSDRVTAERLRGEGETFRARVAAIVAGVRRVLDITEAPIAGASGGIAQDVSEIEVLRTDLARQRQAHVRVLDQLPTAVAMFDAKQRLLFHNAAYRELWGLEASFLDSLPSDGEVLERLRATRQLPEQADFRSWRNSVLEAYRSAEPEETWWHLPDRRTLRVVTNPNPQGGLTYLFEDVSDRVHLESRYNALIRVQRETLDTLAEGVALFGADGRLKLFNQAFLKLWRLDGERLGDEPHIDVVVRLCRDLAPNGPWVELSSAVSGLTDVRLSQTCRMERRDGSVLDCVAEPLPDGATLITFADMTASVNVERALTERNDALEQAGQLRNDFVHHVSYELRSPLTTIIGFAELLGEESIGSLNERQREYAGHITRSSGALLAIINDILDLASIDADAIELDCERVDIVATIEAAAKGVHDRMVEADLKLEIDAPRDIGTFLADPKRLRQVLFNLLSNAAGFSSRGQTIRVTAAKHGGEVSIAVSDQGRGIPDDMKARVFDRFESHTRGTNHKGVGLGLSIVRSFVELHGGRVVLETGADCGTTITCIFPADGKVPVELAAE